MEKQRDKLARRAARKLAPPEPEEGEVTGAEDLVGDDGAPLDPADTTDTADTAASH